jgi:hypothetical protein
MLRILRNSALTTKCLRAFFLFSIEAFGLEKKSFKNIATQKTQQQMRKNAYTFVTGFSLKSSTAVYGHIQYSPVLPSLTPSRSYYERNRRFRTHSRTRKSFFFLLFKALDKSSGDCREQYPVFFFIKFMLPCCVFVLVSCSTRTFRPIQGYSILFLLIRHCRKTKITHIFFRARIFQFIFNDITLLTFVEHFFFRSKTRIVRVCMFV